MNIDLNPEALHAVQLVVYGTCWVITWRTVYGFQVLRRRNKLASEWRRERRDAFAHAVAEKKHVRISPEDITTNPR